MSNSEWHDDAGQQHAEIAPLDLDFSSIDDGAAAYQVEPETGQSRSKLVAPLVVVLSLIAAAVVIVPLTQQSVDPVQNETSAEVVEQPPENIIDEGSPFQEAELAKLRKAAQDTLEQLLEKRLWLEKRNVQLWAAESFDRSTQLASDGDEEYRARKFEQANQLYGEGLAIVTELFEGIPKVIDEAMLRGRTAIDSNQAEEAIEAFKLVQAIEPEHEEAALGLLRVEVLDAVSEALAKAEQFEQQQDYSNTLVELGKVLELDSIREPELQARIAQLEQALLEQRFAEQMSLGYRNLDQGRQTKANEHFAKASQLKPEEIAPKKAIKMVRNQQSLNRMSVHLERAAAMESAENWADAVAAYDRALQIDANLSDAAQRRVVAERRMKMDQALQTLNDDPLRLAKQDLYQKAVKIHKAAQNIGNPGPRLEKQVALLGQQLSASRESLPVLIKSDGFTQVSVQQIARLGPVQEKRLNLIPGRYVAMGSRDGYRDVRREFVVQQGAQNVKVDIRCVEPI